MLVSPWEMIILKATLKMEAWNALLLQIILKICIWYKWKHKRPENGKMLTVWIQKEIKSPTTAGVKRQNTNLNFNYLKIGIYVYVVFSIALNKTNCLIFRPFANYIVVYRLIFQSAVSTTDSTDRYDYIVLFEKSILLTEDCISIASFPTRSHALHMIWTRTMK